jgi:hypothetical protein
MKKSSTVSFELVKQTQSIEANNLNNSQKSTIHPTSLPILETKLSFISAQGAVVHQHNHLKTPHLHSTDCNRFTSGIDRNRQFRFYFTNIKTPCRVYLSYNEKLLQTGDPVLDQNTSNNLAKLDNSFNGRKLSPRTLRSQFKINPKFVEDAKNFTFNKETLSFVPILPPIVPQNMNNNNNNFNPVEQSMTYAEMAVIPISLNTNSITSIHLIGQESGQKKAGKLGASKKAKLASASTVSIDQGHFELSKNDIFQF